MDCIEKVYDQAPSYSYISERDNTPFFFCRGAGIPFYPNNVAYLAAKITIADDGRYLVNWSVSTETGEVVAMKTNLLALESYEEARFYALESADWAANVYDPKVRSFIGAEPALSVLEKLERKVKAILAEREKESEEIIYGE